MMANWNVEHACADGRSVSIKASHESGLGFASKKNAAHSACDQGPFFFLQNGRSKWRHGTFSVTVGLFFKMAARFF